MYTAQWIKMMDFGEEIKENYAHDTVTMQIWKCSKCRCYRVSLEIKRLKHTVDVEISCFSGVSRMHIDLKSTRGHLMPPPPHSICITDLSHPVDYSIFAGEWTHPPGGESSPCWHRNGLVTARLLTAIMAHGHRGYGQRSSPCGPADVGTGQTTGRTRWKHDALVSGIIVVWLNCSTVYWRFCSVLNRTLFM